MVITVTETLKQLDGTPIKDNDGAGNVVDATVRNAFVNALLVPVENEAGVKKAEKYDLAMRVHKTDEVELSVEEAAIIKDCVGKCFAPIVVGQLFKLLDGK